MAVRFDTDTDAYQTVDPAGLPTSNVWSWTCWVYIAVDMDNFQEMLAWRPRIGMEAPSSGEHLEMYYNIVGGGFGNTPALTLPLGVWAKCGVVVNGTVFDFYRAQEGNPLELVSVTDVDTGTPDKMVVGNHRDGPGSLYHFNGRMAALKVWDAALSQAEVEAELAQYDPVRTADLIRFHSFIEAPGVVNEAGSGTDLTAGSTATVTEPGPDTLSIVPPEVHDLSATVPLGLSATAAQQKTAGLAAESALGLSASAQPAKTVPLAATPSLDLRVVPTVRAGGYAVGKPGLSVTTADAGLSAEAGRAGLDVEI